MQKRWGIRLVRAGALFGLLGAYLGSHMAGADHMHFVQFMPIYYW